MAAASQLSCPRCGYPYAFQLKNESIVYCPNCGYGDNSAVGVGTVTT